VEEDSKKTLGKVVQIDERRIQDHLGELVRGTVEETLNGLLDAEADALCGAQRYERSPDRTDYRAGSYDRKLHTKAGEVTLKMPKLRRQPFETAIIERYRRRETSIEEALIEMYLAGVSVRRVEDITEALCGAPGYRQERSPSSTRRSTSTSRCGATGRSRAIIRMCTWTGSCSSAAGPARCATSRCW